MDFLFNPATLVGSRLRLESGLWEKYKVNKLVMEIRPGGATTREGNFIAYIEYDVADNAAAYTGVNAVRNATSHQGSVESNHYTPFNVFSDEKLAMQQRLYCNPNGHTSDLSNYCRLVAVQNLPASAATAFASVHVHWDITFFDAVNESNLTVPAYTGGFATTAGTGGYTWTGINIAPGFNMPLNMLISASFPPAIQGAAEHWTGGGASTQSILRINKLGSYKVCVDWEIAGGTFDANVGAVTLTLAGGVTATAVRYAYDSVQKRTMASFVMTTPGTDAAVVGINTGGGALLSGGYYGIQIFEAPSGISNVADPQSKTSKTTQQLEADADELVSQLRRDLKLQGELLLETEEKLERANKLCDVVKVEVERKPDPAARSASIPRSSAVAALLEQPATPRKQNFFGS